MSLLVELLLFSGALAAFPVDFCPLLLALTFTAATELPNPAKLFDFLPFGDVAAEFPPEPLAAAASRAGEIPDAAEGGGMWG